MLNNTTPYLSSSSNLPFSLFSGFVVSSVTYINDKQKEISQLGKCPCKGPCKDGEPGLVVGLLFIKEYDDSGAQNSDEANPPALQELANHVREQWNLGTCNNSILIAIATVPKQYGISIGQRANHILNDTWLTAILEENFRDRNTFNFYNKIKDVLYMFSTAIKEEMSAKDNGSDQYASSITDSNSNATLYTILILFILLIIIAVVSIILFVVLRHRKENDDVSLRDVWTKKFWLKAGNQYKEAKQTESGNEPDVEKNEDEEVKAKLASTEDLKAVDDIENVELPGKLSKV